MTKLARKARLSKRTVDAIARPASGFVRVWDTELKGFYVRVRANGRMTYELRYRVGRRQAALTIGDHGTFTPEQARQAASEAKRAVRQGGDPLAARRAVDQAITLRELIERYLSEGPVDKPNKRASSWATDATNLRRHVEPLLGARAVKDLTPGDLSRWQRDVAIGKTARRGKTAKELGAATPGSSQGEKPKTRGRVVVRGGRGAAARAMTSFSSMLSWAARAGIIEGNPALRVEKLISGRRERFLTGSEAATLWVKLAEMEEVGAISRDHADLFRLLALTGARRGEVLGLCWREVDFERSMIVLPPDRHKAGSKGHGRTLHLDAAALGILRARQRVNGDAQRIVPWVFAKLDGSGPIEPPKRAWAAVRKMAGMPDLRLHDLRHTYASLLLQDGVPLAHVGKALGHRKAATTERYAHLRDEATQRGAAVVAAVYAAGANGPGER